MLWDTSLLKSAVTETVSTELHILTLGFVLETPYLMLEAAEPPQPLKLTVQLSHDDKKKNLIIAAHLCCLQVCEPASRIRFISQRAATLPWQLRWI